MVDAGLVLDVDHLLRLYVTEVGDLLPKITDYFKFIIVRSGEINANKFVKSR